MEIWKPIPSLDSTYEASNLGRIRRSKRGPHTRPGLVLKPREQRGYSRYCLWIDGKQHMRSGHRLVVEAFIGPIPDGMQINHLNGVKDDNRVENLEICTASANTLHGFRSLGRVPHKNPLPGERNGRAKLKDADIPIIKSLYQSGLSQQKIAAQYGVSQTSISRIVIGKGWV